ncbi:SMI1 / KNR4 family (SUKH-1) [Streptomyces sp. AmelKG-E11A]|nr:SMI1 / KNR4 family (SUKH-1) [Streptomyces sp. AmelKG-E11A]
MREDMTSDVLPAWNAITDWLAVHAPASHTVMRPGATEADIRTAEQEWGVRLPADLVKLLTACDGTVDVSAPDRDPDEYEPGLFLTQHHLLPLKGIEAVRDSGGGAEQFWGSWIPFAVSDYALTPWSGLAVDADGRLAAFVLADGEPPSAPHVSPGYVSLGEFLDALAQALTEGTGPLMDEATPGLHRGALVWGPLPGDDSPWRAAHPDSGSTV